MKTVLTDDMLKGYFKPDAAPGELARQVLLAARASAQASEKLLGRLAIQATTDGISLIRAERLGKPATAGARRLVERAREELYEYFQGKRAFFSVPVDLSETPDFQRRVLEAARRIPFGEVRPYAWVAQRIGHPRAVRAVGTRTSARCRSRYCPGASGRAGGSSCPIRLVRRRSSSTQTLVRIR